MTAQNEAGQNELKYILLTITLIMTAIFGWQLSNEWYISILFSLTLVGLQAAALLYLPIKAKIAAKEKRIFPCLIHWSSVTVVLLMSITATIATLSNSEDMALIKLKEREVLQKSIDAYIEHDYITKALNVREKLNALPSTEPTLLQSAANRINSVTGLNGSYVTNGFILLLAILLDLSIILLGNNPKEQTSPKNGGDDPESNKSDKEVKHQNNKVEISNLSPELKKVLEGLENGSLEKATVKQIRVYLGSSQRTAMSVANEYRESQGHSISA